MPNAAIFLVRHGETAWNRERRVQGHLDSPLTTRGIAQARVIGRRLATLPEAAAAEIVASPLLRARRTAAIIRAAIGAGQLRLDERLREISCGAWDGLDRKEIARRSPGIFAGDGRYEFYFRAPDGERYDAFAARIAEWLGAPREKPVVAVTHGIVSRVLRGLYAGLPRAEAVRLPAPQDCVFRLAGGAIEEIAVGGE